MTPDASHKTSCLNSHEPFSSADIARIRADFPILEATRGDARIVYLDNAATTQKPLVVIDAVVRYYTEQNANVHRGIHYLSQVATDEYEAAREKVRGFLGAARSSEIVFTSGATEGINLVAQTYGRQQVGPGDEIVVSAMEHHSNIVPWQMLCEERGATLRVLPVTDAGELDLDGFEKYLTRKTKLLAIAHVSNAVGTINPVKRLIEAAHASNVPVLVDGAQSAGHVPLDVTELGCDFFVCSGHKMCGPTGIGVLYGTSATLDSIPPWQGGGDMIRSVTFEKTTYADPPAKFEAGTPNIAGAIGLGAAVEYLARLGMGRIAAHERDLLECATHLLEQIDGLRLVGTAHEKTGIVSFVMDGIHPHDVSQFLDEEGIAVRAGHHCAEPLMTRLGAPASVRVSVAFYNTNEELDALGPALERVREVFR